MAGFREFLLKTNALALAVGVFIGVALGNVVNSLVNDIIMPPVGLALGGTDFSQLKIVLKQATVAGDPTTEVAIRWGSFVNVVIGFIVIALVVYLISSRLVKEPDPAPSKTCPFCKEPNALEATRCRACTQAI
jgi:large conductance mechanosensitive channel